MSRDLFACGLLFSTMYEWGFRAKPVPPTPCGETGHLYIFCFFLLSFSSLRFFSWYTLFVCFTFSIFLHFPSACVLVVLCLEYINHVTTAGSLGIRSSTIIHLHNQSDHGRCPHQTEYTTAGRRYCVEIGTFFNLFVKPTTRTTKCNHLMTGFSPD